MEEFIHLGGSGGGVGGGGGNSRGSFLYFPSSTTNTTSTSTNPPPGMVAPPPGYYGYGPTSLQPLKSEAGPSQYPPQREAIHVGEEISPRDMEAIKAKIMSHPQYSTLLVAFMECQKVGAPPDVVERLTAISRRVESCPSRRHEPTSDPELDQFMEAYCNMLVKYREELSRPIQEAMDFLKRVETQLNSLTNGASARFFTSDTKCEVGSSEEDGSGGEGEVPEIDACTEEKELKHHLLKKY
ncbi:homeobox protein knotted-1-like 12, partial [Typha latifolia]|uniref:homeobox protein knotted-1-like 12 n=1 Tax=Typha latifolia TaxID=4733 RepID=UPI003C2B662D